MIRYFYGCFSAQLPELCIITYAHCCYNI